MAGTSLNDLLYEFLKKITSATSGSTEDMAMVALLNAIDPNFVLDDAVFKNYREAIYNITASGATETIDLANGNVQRIKMDQACEFTMPTIPTTTGETTSFVLIIEPTNFAMSWAASPPLKWMTTDKLGPATVAADLVVVVTFIADTYEGTDRWLGFISGREVA